MNNLKNDEYYIGKILTDLHFIVEHMEGVTIRTLGEKRGAFRLYVFSFDSDPGKCQKANRSL